MEINKIIKIIKTERECVVRACNDLCNRHCDKCDLLLDENDIIHAYDEILLRLYNENN